MEVFGLGNYFWKYYVTGLTIRIFGELLGTLSSSAGYSVSHFKYCCKHPRISSRALFRISIPQNSFFIEYFSSETRERELSGEEQVLPFPRTRVPFPAFPSHLPRIPVPVSRAAHSSLYRSPGSHAQTHTHTLLHIIFKNFNIVKFKQNTPLCALRPGMCDNLYIAKKTTSRKLPFVKGSSFKLLQFQ